MKLEIRNISNSLNKAHLAQCTYIDEITLFKENYTTLLKSIKPTDNEETLKDYINNFFRDTYYKNKFTIKENIDNIDLVIYNGKDDNDKIGVIIETKALKNKAEMITIDYQQGVATPCLNRKAFQELILYYLEERIINNNLEIKHLIITNSIDWFVFNVTEFERIFYQNKALVKNFNDWYNGHLESKNKDWFYTSVAKPFIENEEENIVCTYFQLNIDLLNNENTLLELYKIFSPEHLLKLPFQNDSNTLNREFYNEMLHILGLQETKVKNVRRIERLNEKDRQVGSFIENTINILQSDEIIMNKGLQPLVSIEKAQPLVSIEKAQPLVSIKAAQPLVQQFSETEEEQLFSIGLELCITWLNRILFLKLLESQLVKYNSNKEYLFLNSSKIRDFEELRELFFEVLAVKLAERKKVFQTKYEKIPYLNSSLFELTDLEKETVKINQLKNHYEIEIFNATVLKDENGKKISGSKPILQYLFEFLDSYNFAGDNKAEIQKKNKTIINSSVLGLIFEKINGYKEGSYYTPGFVTMYMCRENIRKAVVEKFKTNKEFAKVNSIADIKNSINFSNIKKANEIFNSIKICDPAVGSGHFLVSALNELIALKSELKILTDKEGILLWELYIEVINDELYLSVKDELFSYNYKSKNSQNIQETIFHEKQKLIENCLFGVDINPKSVNICRLRLWIELLKNAYYIVPNVGTGHALSLQQPELQTLPNIDINIKCGNSLISRFSLNGNGQKSATNNPKLKKIALELKTQVGYYKNIQDKRTKFIIIETIKKLKENFESLANPTDKAYIELNKKKSERDQRFIAFSKDELIQWEMKMNRLDKEIVALQNEYNEKQKNIYYNSFEWRFEFPEVLDDNGYFVGFDLIIGNPPYIRQERIKNIKNYLQSNYKVYNSMSDILTYFIELSYNLLSKSGIFSFIISNKFAKAEYGDKLRSFIKKNTTLLNYVNFSNISVFDEASVDTCIISFSKIITKNSKFIFSNVLKTDFIDEKIDFSKLQTLEIPQNSLSEKSWFFLSDKSHNILRKINEKGLPLKDWNIEINFGIKTGFNEAFIISKQQKELFIKEHKNNETILKPLLRGRDIKKYSFEFKDLWLISTFPSKNIDINNYPAIEKYLKQFERQLQQNGEKNSRKKTSNKWFETQDNVAYWKNFETDKIIYAEFSSENSFIWDNQKYYPLDTTWSLTGQDCNKYLLALLNSKLIWFYLKQIVSVLGTQAFRMKKIYLEQLPLVKLKDKEQQPLIKLVDKIIEAKKENTNADTQKLEKQIDDLIYKLYKLSPEEIDIIETKY